MWMELVQYLNLGIDCTSVRQRDCFEPFRVVVSWELPSGSAWCTVTSGSITPKESLQRFTEDMSTKVYFSQHGWWDSTFHRSLATDASVVGNTWFRLSGCCQAARILDMFFFTSTHFWHLWVPKFAWLWKTNAFYYLILYLFISHRSYCHINIYIRIYIYTPYIYIYLQSISHMIIQKHHPTSSNMYPSNIRFHNSFHSSKRLLRDHSGPSHRSRSGQRPYHLAGHCHRRRPHWRSRPVLHCLGRRGLDWMRQKGAI